MKNFRFILLLLLVAETTKTADGWIEWGFENVVKPIGKDVVLPAMGAALGYLATYYLQKSFQSPKDESEIRFHNSQINAANSSSKNSEQQTDLFEIQTKEAKISLLKAQLDAAHHIKDPYEREVREAQIKNEIKKASEGNGLDQLPEEQLQKIKKKHEKKTNNASKSGLLSKLGASIAFIQTTSGGCADFLANHSFAHITNLDCFKDTFIQAHAKNINRALVATTVVALIYGGYKLYDKYTNADDDEYDNDKDDDEDEQ